MGTEIVLQWDERKRRANLRKHGFDFGDCAEVFSGPVDTLLDDRYEYGETRLLTYGLLRGNVVVVTHTEGGGIIRVISMRKANQYEKENFFRNTFSD